MARDSGLIFAEQPRRRRWPLFVLAAGLVLLIAALPRLAVLLPAGVQRVDAALAARFVPRYEARLASLQAENTALHKHLAGAQIALAENDALRQWAGIERPAGRWQAARVVFRWHDHAELAGVYPVGAAVCDEQGRFAGRITEAGAGSDVSGIKTTATRTADGWVLNGSKLWIHNAPVADVAFVLARTDKDAGHRGMSIFIVDCSRDGVSRGPKEHKMGQRSSQVGELHFNQVRLPAQALLGPENRGFHIMMSVLNKGRVGIGALAVGIARAGLEAAIAYAKQREQFGKPIADFQGVQFMLADIAKDTEAARLLVHSAAYKIDTDAPDTSIACSMAKCFAGDVAVQHSGNAVQIFGGGGYIRGVEVERLYRDAKITQIYEGTNQIQRMIIGRNLLA